MDDAGSVEGSEGFGGDSPRTGDSGLNDNMSARCASPFITPFMGRVSACLGVGAFSNGATLDSPSDGAAL
jgi:hypothetical protein